MADPAKQDDPPLHVLNTASGHLKFSFDTEEDAVLADKVITDMLKRGYSIFVETSRGLRKVARYNIKHRTYIIKGENLPADPELEAKLDMTIAELGLSTRAYNCLYRAGIATIRQLITHTPDQVLNMPGCGESSLNNINVTLRVFGHKLAAPTELPAQTTKATAVAPIAGG